MRTVAKLAPLSAHPTLAQQKRGRNIRMVSFGEMYQKPLQKGGYAVVAFNIRNFPLRPADGWAAGYIGPSTVTPVLRAARELEAPVVLEIADSELGNEGAPYTGVISRYGFTEAGILSGLNNFVQHIFAEYERLDMAGIPIGIHYDHGSRWNVFEGSILAGFTSAAFDGGKMKNWEELTATAREWVNYAHPRGVGIEGEIETVGGEKPTVPEEAICFALETGVDVLVVTLKENPHGNLPGKSVMEGERLRAVRQALPEMPVNLHGGSGFDLKVLENATAQGLFQKLNYATVLYEAMVRKVPGWLDLLNNIAKQPVGTRPKASRSKLAFTDPFIRKLPIEAVKAAENEAYKAAIAVMTAVGNVNTAKYYSG